MKRIVSVMLSILFTLVPYNAPDAQASGETAEWSILWLIIPEIDAVVDGTTYKSSMSSADRTALSNLASTFESGVETEVKALNGLTLDLKITQTVSTLPVKRVTGGRAGDRYLTADDISEILNAYAPLREGSYDSLIVMAQFQNVPHGYGALNMGWMSFCPAPYVTNIAALGYNLQLHEWLHQMEGIANNILGSNGKHPSPDGLQGGNYLDIYLKDKYSGVNGEAFLTKFYFEMLAGTLPANGNVTSGFPKEYWTARPSKSRPSKVEFTFTGSGGNTVTREYKGASVVVGRDAVITVTYDYDVKLKDGEDWPFFLDMPGIGFENVARNDVVFSGDREFSIDLTKVNGGPLVVGRNYNFDTYGNIQAKAAGNYLDPNIFIPFKATEGGVADAETGAPADAVIVPSNAQGAFINLTDETITLPDGFTVAAYSLDGGTKWKKGDLPADAKFRKLFDKGMTLWVSDGWNTKDIKEDKIVVAKKGVPTSASVIKFSKIEARPKRNAEKLKPFYLSETWELRKGGTIATTTVYEWAETSDKKTPDGDWQSVPNGGFEIESGKTKTTVLFRTPATGGSKYTPASPIFKQTPATFGKAPKYKIKTDKKTSTQTIKMQATDMYQLDNAAPKKASAGDFDVTKLSGTFFVWKSETGKKPRSEKQEITLPGTETTTDPTPSPTPPIVDATRTALVWKYDS